MGSASGKCWIVWSQYATSAGYSYGRSLAGVIFDWFRRFFKFWLRKYLLSECPEFTHWVAVWIFFGKQAIIQSLLKKSEPLASRHRNQLSCYSGQGTHLWRECEKSGVAIWCGQLTLFQSNILREIPEISWPLEHLLDLQVCLAPKLHHQSATMLRVRFIWSVTW